MDLEELRSVVANETEIQTTHSMHLRAISNPPQFTAITSIATTVLVDQTKNVIRNRDTKAKEKKKDNRNAKKARDEAAEETKDNKQDRGKFGIPIRPTS